jgi:phosphoribosylaminoimidazolecarboxamide formyltransferase/IMP cyclohydrolase
MSLRKISRALLSVSDKTGLVAFAQGLAGHGVTLISTGGTAKALRDAGLTVLDVSEITDFPEMMDGRVKTLHPNVHGGLLALRDKSDHAAAMKTHGIEGIDLLVCNLYPFEATVARGADFETTIENIDIGGPAMTRSAAKNHDWTTVVVDVEDYGAVLDEMATNGGATTLALRRTLAQRAFARTAAYDAAVSTWFAGELEKVGV